MNVATPKQALPDEVRRREVLVETMREIDGLEDLPLAEQVGKLSEAQAILAAVLDNDPHITQPHADE